MRSVGTCLFFVIVSVTNGLVTKQTIQHETEKEFIINNTQEYVLSFPDTEGDLPYRIEVSSNLSTIAYPVIVVVRQERRVVSWQIPLLVQSELGVLESRKTARTLCYDTAKTLNAFRLQSRFSGILNVKKNFTVSLSTSSPTNVEVSIISRIVKDYFIKSSTKYNVQFTPSEPVFYSYNFPTELVDGEEIKTVLIHITSEDDVCFTVSIQPKVCPVKDLNDDITYQGKFQTINTKGGFTVPKSQFPDGFYLVFVSKGDNYECSQAASLLPLPRASTITAIKQTTSITFEIRPGRTAAEYVAATMMVLWANIGICIIFAIGTYIFFYCGRYRDLQYIDQEDVEVRPMAVTSEELDSYFEKTEFKLSDFVKRGRDNDKKALNYFWHITNIAIFYGIPVVQLMISYQRIVDYSGNLDLCYHNFHCSHPFYFTDFNHIYSNIGYVLFGILFLSITFFKSIKVKNNAHCGIPKFHGLYYSMGIALIFEGFLSACYHVCPNQSNFQFDTSFMYVMAVLIMVKLYQNRHPDINASAYGTFSVLGIAVIMAMFGILYNSVAIMVVFVLCYIFLCIYLAFKIYFFGYVCRGWEMLIKSYKSDTPMKKVMKPVRLGRFITLTIANVCNFIVAITGMALYPSHVDFGTFLLGILMMNAVIHAIFYMVMKMIHGEKICIEAIVHGVLGLIAWAAGSYFFLDSATVWSLTPAESRQLNKECIIMDFYDTHDIWHLISAPALFFSFMFLLTLDDDLYETPQNLIDVF